jgi:hypothetical protein
MKGELQKLHAFPNIIENYTDVDKNHRGGIGIEERHNVSELEDRSSCTMVSQGKAFTAHSYLSLLFIFATHAIFEVITKEPVTSSHFETLRIKDCNHFKEERVDIHVLVLE